MICHAFAAMLVAATVLIAAPGWLAAAQTRIGLNGGRPSQWPILDSLLAGAGFTQEGWYRFASRVGENWLPGTTPVPVNYPAQLGPLSGPFALTADQSTAVGQRNLHAAIMSALAAGQPVAVAGVSEGTLVIDRELTYLQNDPNAPPAQDLTFYVFGDMARGLGQMYLSGVTVPFIGETFGPLPQSQYNTVVVIEQWDGWANPPDRPWNLLADLNAVMGALYTVNRSNDHSQTALDSMSQAVEVSQTTSTRGGTTTTYIVPRQQLPLTRPLLQIGVPTWVVNKINRLLMPLIQAGYSALTPSLGPHIEHSRLVFTDPLAPVAGPFLTIKQRDLEPVETGIPSADAPLDAVGALTPLTATTAHQAVARDGISSLGGRQHRQVAGAADSGRLSGADPQPGAAHRPRPEQVCGRADSRSKADVDGQAKPSGVKKTGPAINRHRKLAM